MLLDTEGYAIPFATDDQYAEAEALCNGPACSEDPAEWPSWCDADCWAPTADDEAWLARQNADDDEDWPAYALWSQRLDELYQASQWQDRVEAIYDNGVTDDDIMAAGLSVG
jgi:hypothetical protein